METVGSFLGRFKNLKAPDRSVRLAVREAVTDIVGVDMQDENIKINGDSTLYLSPHSVVKAIIFENKREIISRINNILKKEQIKELL